MFKQGGLLLLLLGYSVRRIGKRIWIELLREFADSHVIDPGTHEVMIGFSCRLPAVSNRKSPQYHSNAAKQNHFLLDGVSIAN